MYIESDEWFKTIQREYLAEFIPGGGAAVKFVVPARGATAARFWQRLGGMARVQGMEYVTIDARQTRLHMIEQVFFALAAQLDWDELTRTFLSRMLTKKAYVIPAEGTDFRCHSIALANSIDENELRRHVRQLLTATIMKDYNMSKEFRIAMTRLCLAQLDPEDVSPSMEESIKQWLQGELQRIYVLKSALIFQKIARNNARYMLISLAHWLKLVGRQGLVLGLDISRYMEKRPKVPDDTSYYGTVALLDMYEVLRQFIDGIDEVESLFMVVLASPAFLSDEKRGINRYDALKLRIWDEVHDKRRANPLGALIRLTEDDDGVRAWPPPTMAVRT